MKALLSFPKMRGTIPKEDRKRTFTTTLRTTELGHALDELEGLGECNQTSKRFWNCLWNAARFMELDSHVSRYSEIQTNWPRSDQERRMDSEIRHLKAIVHTGSEAADYESPAWHESALRETEARVAAGEEQQVDWVEAKRRLRGTFVRIRILESAIGDLEAGRDFYDWQEDGVGDCFQDCLLSDIDFLVLYGGIHRQVFGFHRLLSRRFPYAI